MNYPMPPKPQRRHTIAQQSAAAGPKAAKKPGWSLQSLFGIKDEKKEQSAKDKLSKAAHARAASVDYSADRGGGPVVDLFGPSLFNITPPQLV